MSTIQPALHDLATVLRAPDLVLSTKDGQVSSGAVEGWYVRDRRALSWLDIEVEGGRTDLIGWQLEGPSAAVFHHAVTRPGDFDPNLLARRHRRLSPGRLVETLTLHNQADEPVTLDLRLRAGTDLATIGAVRAGQAGNPRTPRLQDGTIRWADSGMTVEAELAPRPGQLHVAEPGLVTAEWRVELTAGQRWSLTLTATCEQGQCPGFAPTPAHEAPQWTVPESVRDSEWGDLVAANLADLEALQLSDPEWTDDVFAAAGSPWYLTLFGRDALWTARLLLPLGTTLAAGTLRTLARRQGTRHDEETEEAPGKILHEARPFPLHTAHVRLPARYYGTIDATPLWVCLLHDTWRAGMPADDVRALLPNLTAAMGWITGRDADPDGDGLLEYFGSTRGGLANQGWKDSGDAIRHVDGRIATPPVALCEVQAYAHEAAVSAATLADAFGIAGGEGWRAWAHGLRERFAERFWLTGSSTETDGPYPAIALDGDKRPVSGVSSNIGHLLGTGIVDTGQARVIAERLTGTGLCSAWGLRTLTTASAAFHPLSYHRGSVWPHDTAIAITGLAAEGHRAEADVLAHRLLAATRHFAGRPPELYAALDDASGAGEVDQPPVRYPTACHPQAWAAAAAVTAALQLVSGGRSVQR